jgi:hypothetical protein
MLLSYSYSYSYSLTLLLSSEYSKPLIVGTVYLTPDADKTIFLEKLSSLLATPSLLRKHLILTGDFNINWNGTSHIKTLFRDTLLSFGIQQHSAGITFTSHLGNESLLDHNYVSGDLKVAHCKILTCDRSISDHYATYLVVPRSQTQREPRKVIRTRAYHRFDYFAFHRDYSNLPILQIVNDKSKSIHERTLLLESSVSDLLDLHLPIKSIRVRGPSKPWLTKDLLRLISIKNRFYRKVYQSALPASANQVKHYNKFKNYVINQIRLMKKAYYSEKVSESSQSFFKCLRSLTGKQQTSAQINNLKHNGTTATTESQIAHAMNQFFTDIPDRLNPPDYLAAHDSSTLSDSDLMTFTHVTSDMVLKQILSLKSKKRGGLGEIPAFVYQSIADLVALPISMLINESLDTNIFPDCLKIALVTPIYKKGDQSDPSNYRPISSLPILSKLFEMNIKNQLMDFLENHSLLCSRQFGYRKHHSTEQLLQSLLQQWRTSLDKKQATYISTLSLDVKKAFDSVNHQLLVTKLQKFSLSSAAIELIKSYLSNRFQVMKIGTTKSSQLPITCGVPQGSILGPVLFLLTVDDLLRLFPTSFAYADDTLIFTEGSTPEQSVENCNYLMARVAEWYRNNLLRLNYSKTQYCIFSNRKVNNTYSINIDQSKIDSKDTLTLLGVTLDSGLTFGAQIDKLTSKVNSLIHLSSKFKRFLNIEQATSLYTAIVRPSLEYCSSLLLNITLKLSNKLEYIQNRAIRVILSAPRKFSVSLGRLLINLPTLSSRRKYLFTNFVHYKLTKLKASKHLLLMVDSCKSHRISLRTRHSFIKPFSRTNFGVGSFMNQLHSILTSHCKKTPKNLLSFES